MPYTGPGPGVLISAGQGIIYFFVGLFTSVFVDLTELLIKRINIGEIIHLNGPIVFIITGAINIVQHAGSIPGIIRDVGDVVVVAAEKASVGEILIQ